MRRTLLIVCAVLLGARAGPAAADVEHARAGDPAAAAGAVVQHAPPQPSGGELPGGRPGASDPTGTPILTRPPPAVTRDQPLKSAAMPPPIAFFVAHGDADACGADCSEWIGADGAIDAGASARLRAVLDRLGRRKLPIYFHSPGGSVAGALALGRLMRERELTARVGLTVPQGCDPKQARGEACDKLKRSGRELAARIEAGRTMCNSACVYALVGAAVREIAPGASLGIHSSSFHFFAGTGHTSAGPSRITMRAAVAASYARLEHYLGEMGIDRALVAAVRDIPNERVRFLTRAEIWRFNIDRRSFVEGDWRLFEEPSHAISKVFVAGATGDHSDFRTAVIRLSCSAADRLRVDVAREHSGGDEAGSVGITLLAGGASRVLMPGRRAIFSGNRSEFDVGTAYVAPSFFLAAGDSIAVSAAAQASAMPPRTVDPAVTLSTMGLVPALSKLLTSCGIPPSLKIGAPVVAEP